MPEKLTVYGPGCKKCRQLKENAEAAIAKTASTATLGYVTDMSALAEAGIMSTPALAVDGKIVSSGKVLKPAEIAKLL
ncbi:MAG: thioredoxin family protein [Gordonibacter sp.]|uniref:thioredoxin family protein n=1 Tax=Gordonibacter sp. TaxID=1968902 RepID=UPI002FCB8C18